VLKIKASNCQSGSIRNKGGCQQWFPPFSFTTPFIPLGNSVSKWYYFYMRKVIFANEEIYHIYNRGTDKRVIFEDEYDFQRFLQSLQEFNTLEPIGSIYENSFVKKQEHAQLGNSVSKSEELVEIIAYCLNPNHYHLLLKQISDGGISKFMHRLGLGYTKYFNTKHERSGALFQGKFKAIHVNSNEYLLHLSVYVNLNYKVHLLGNSVSKSSWKEYMGEIEKEGVICEKGIILGQFMSIKEYEVYAKNVLQGIQERKLLAEEKF
jgi:REP element-mobilizing transposase RayT